MTVKFVCVASYNPQRWIQCHQRMDDVLTLCSKYTVPLTVSPMSTHTALTGIVAFGRAKRRQTENDLARTVQVG